MTQSNSGSHAAVGEAVAERFVVEMASVFPGEDGENAPEGGRGALADVLVDDDLLAFVPVPPRIDFVSLEQEVTRQRRIVVRGNAGIPVAGVICIGGSLLIHALLIGAFLWCFYLALHATPGAGERGAAGDMDVGGSSGGSLFVEDVPPGPAGVKGMGTEIPKAAPSLAPSPIAPQKPPLAVPTPVQPQVAFNPPPSPSPLPPAPDAEIIGIPAGPENLGDVHPDQPKPPPLAARTPVGLPITAPPQASVVAPPANGNSRTGMPVAAGGSHGASARPGLDDDDGDDDAGTISLLNPAHDGGNGGGLGGQRGSGIDRGMFGGGDQKVQVRDLSPPNYQGPAPNGSATLRVLVHADGSVGTIEIEQSSGNADYDDACKWSARRAQYTPARVDGKYIDGYGEITFGYPAK